MPSGVGSFSISLRVADSFALSASAACAVVVSPPASCCSLVLAVSLASARGGVARTSEDTPLSLDRLLAVEPTFASNRSVLLYVSTARGSLELLSDDSSFFADEDELAITLTTDVAAPAGLTCEDGRAVAVLAGTARGLRRAFQSRLVWYFPEADFSGADLVRAAIVEPGVALDVVTATIWVAPVPDAPAVSFDSDEMAVEFGGVSLAVLKHSVLSQFF